MSLIRHLRGLKAHAKGKLLAFAAEGAIEVDDVKSVLLRVGEAASITFPLSFEAATRHTCEVLLLFLREMNASEDLIRRIQREAHIPEEAGKVEAKKSFSFNALKQRLQTKREALSKETSGKAETQEEAPARKRVHIETEVKDAVEPAAEAPTEHVATWDDADDVLTSGHHQDQASSAVPLASTGFAVAPLDESEGFEADFSQFAQASMQPPHANHPHPPPAPHRMWGGHGGRHSAPPPQYHNQ